MKIPILSDDKTYDGSVDLIEQKVPYFIESMGLTVMEDAIPGKMLLELDDHRAELIESLAHAAERIGDASLDKKPTEDALRAGIHRASFCFSLRRIRLA